MRADAILPIPATPDLMSGTHLSTSDSSPLSRSSSGEDISGPTLQAVHLERQIHRAVTDFCTRHVRVDLASGTVGLPAVFKECWNIFGGGPVLVLRWLAQYLPVLTTKPKDHWRIVILSS